MKPNDFAEDVLAILKHRKVTFHGCAPDYLSYNSEGDIKIWFYGHRNGKPWAGGITIKNRDDIENAVIHGDSNLFANVCEQIIDHSSSRYE